MEPEDDPDQLPALEVLQRMLQVATPHQLDPSRRTARSQGLTGGFHFGRQLVAYVPDRLQGELRRDLVFQRFVFRRFD